MRIKYAVFELMQFVRRTDTAADASKDRYNQPQAGLACRLAVRHSRFSEGNINKKRRQDDKATFLTNFIQAGCSKGPTIFS